VPLSRPRQGRIRAAAAIALAIFLVALPGSAAAAASPPRLDAKAWILTDPSDGSLLAAKAPDRRLPIASTTKLMTAYLALHALKPNQMVTVPSYRPSNPAEITLGLRAGERIRVRDLLYGLLLPSASDAAITLADAVAGSVPAFVDDMNRAARKLGLADTSYANPIGLDDPDNYSSAHDLVTLASILLRNRLFARIVDTPAATLSSGDHPRTVTSRNTVLGQAPWVNGVKTGHTLGAGYVLVGSGTRGSTTLISAVLGTPSEYARDQSTLALLDYGFSLYHPVAEFRRGEEVTAPQLDYRDEHLPLVAQRPLTVTVREGQRVDTRFTAPDEVSGPVRKGQRLGRVTVTVDGRPAATSPLVAAHAVSAATTLDKVESAAQNPIALIALLAIVILVVVLLISRRRGSRTVETPDPPARQERQRSPRQRTPEERRKMHEERMRRRRQRMEGEEGAG
jgi:serine-type D-Ala-D-Ala carboxypeptidase (penicillin-binding protein 5/6)